MSVESVQEVHSPRLQTLLFAAGVCSGRPGEGGGSAFTYRHADVVREILGQFSEAKEIGRFGDYFLIVFANPHEAVRFSLQLQVKIRTLSDEIHQPVHEQISMDMVESPLAEDPDSGVSANAYEKYVPLCRWLAGLSKGGQILLTRLAFDEARCTLKKPELKEFGPLSWIAHGPCRVPDMETPLEICEIRETGDGSINPPAGLEKAKTAGTDEETVVWGWRPGPGASVPGTRNVLDEKFADGRFGEEWVGGDPGAKEKRLFKFCFRTDWVQQLKEQEAVFQTVKTRVGQNRNILAIHGISFNEPPYYFVTEFFEGKDLISWASERGGAPGIPFATRLELVAQAASGLQGTHEARILHRDLRPEHIFVAGTGVSPKEVQVKLANFGVGHVGLGPSQPDTDDQPAAAAPPAAADGPPLPSPADRYKAPEVIAGQQPTAKSEIYSLGVILCQLILGNLGEILTPERMTEIVGALKREGLAAVFAADPEQRTVGAGRLAGELRTANKERESRVTWQGQMSRRQLIQTIVMATLSVASAVILAVYGPRYLRRKPPVRAKNVPAKPDAKPGDKTGAGEKDAAEEGKLLSDESREAKAETEDGEDSSEGAKTRRRPASAVREAKKKEEVKQSAEMLFKLIVFPIAIVVIIGTAIQQFGPAIIKHFRKPPPPPPSDS